MGPVQSQGFLKRKAGQPKAEKGDVAVKGEGGVGATSQGRGRSLEPGTSRVNVP